MAMKKLLILGTVVGGISAIFAYLSSDKVAKDILARTIWGEARGDGYDGMVAVANVIKNRAKIGGWWGNSIVAVCLMPWQFSMWNKGEINGKKALSVDTTDPQFTTALGIAQGVLNGDVPDNTGGATHYHTTSVNPSWADNDKIVARIGSHIFYKGIA